MYIDRRKLFSRGLKATIASTFLGGPSIMANPQVITNDRQVMNSYSVQLQLKFTPLHGDQGFLDFDRDAQRWENKQTFLTTIDQFQRSLQMSLVCRMRNEGSFFTKQYFFNSTAAAEDFISQLFSSGALRKADLEAAQYKFEYSVSA